MSELRIAVILGSTRPGRRGQSVADRVMERAKARTGADYELVDLLDYPLPHMDEPLPPSLGQYAGEHTRAVEQLRGILSAVKIAHVQQQLAFSVFTDFDEDGTFTPNPRNETAMTTQFDQVESWARALRTVRS